jgi:hypothetical protein
MILDRSGRESLTHEKGHSRELPEGQKAERILRILRMHVHDLNMIPSITVYVKWGKGRRVPLRFSKSGIPRLEEDYSRHFLAPGSNSKKKRKLAEQAALESQTSEVVPTEDSVRE